MNIVGITGAAGSGKDTLAEMIKNDGWERFAYADALKHICMDYLGLSYNDVYTQEGKLRYTEFWGVTNREILQKVGTDAMRNGFCKNVWIKIAELKLKDMLAAGKKVIVTDVRFDNEAELIEKLGGCVIKIVRNINHNGLTEKELAHDSEKGISNTLISFEIFNNLSKEDLKIEFNTKLLDFENRFEDIYASMKKQDSNGNIRKYIHQCKKFMKYIPRNFMLTKQGKVRFEWFDNYNGTFIGLIANLEKETMQFYVAKNKNIVESNELIISKDNFDFINEKIAGELYGNN